jgi:uncharacterized protein (DUF362 family)
VSDLQPQDDPRDSLAQTQAPSPTLSTGKCTRRKAILSAVGAAAGVAGVAGCALLGRWWHKPQPVFVAKNQCYDGPLAQTIRDGLLAAGVDPAWLRGRRVLLKPNMVEPSRSSPQMTTHPAVVVAAAEVFSAWGAEVRVGEAPGHVRDTDWALLESGLDDALRDARLPFADLNYQESRPSPNRGRRSKLQEFSFPRDVLEADLVVSMPKLKTHHWVGMTASMKNLFGTLPGLIYGWPKNVFHYTGIAQAVVDISASLPPTIAIVDAILCMEGDGPIMGTPKPMGLLVIGGNTTAVDATCARIIGIPPERIPYLAMADNWLGPLDPRRIPQCGERPDELAEPFALIDAPHLAQLRG